MLISVCGKSGSGKSFLSNILVKNNNAIHLDIDKINHSILKNRLCKNEIIDTFGSQILNNNEIDRKKLGKIVFSDNKEMDKLALITEKYTELEIDSIIEQNKDKIIILDWILLTKTKYFNISDIKILLDIPYDIRKKRTMKRDNITEEEFNLRDSSSIDYNENEFDFIIKNKNDIKRLVIKHE